MEGNQEESPQGMSTSKLSLFLLSLLITLLLLLLLLYDMLNRCRKLKNRKEIRKRLQMF